MAKHRAVPSDQELDAALARSGQEPDGPTITTATYRAEPELDLFIFTINDGRRLVIPREQLQAVHKATPEQAANMDLGDFGDTVWWPQIDEGHTLVGLLAGRYGTQAWMARLNRELAAAA